MKRNRSKAKPGSQVVSLLTNLQSLAYIGLALFIGFIIAQADVAWFNGRLGWARIFFGAINWILEIAALYAVVRILMIESVRSWLNGAGAAGAEWVMNLGPRGRIALMIGLVLLIVALAIGIIVSL